MKFKKISLAAIFCILSATVLMGCGNNEENVQEQEQANGHGHSH